LKERKFCRIVVSGLIMENAIMMTIILQSDVKIFNYKYVSMYVYDNKYVI